MQQETEPTSPSAAADHEADRMRPHLFTRLTRRLPFTTAMILTILTVASIAGLLGRPIATPELNRWGFGWVDIVRGEFWRLLTAPFLILRPYMALTISGILLFFVGSCELLLRTRRTMVVFAVAHVTGYVGAFSLLTLLGRAGWSAAGALAVNRDVGASNGAFGAAGAILVFLPPSLRAVGFLLLVSYLLGAMVVEQELWDVQHMLAFVTGTALGVFFLRRDSRDLSGLRLGGDILHRQRPRLMSWLVGGIGLVNVLAAALLPQHAGFRRLEEILPLGVHHGPRMLLFFSGLLLVVVSGGIRRAQRGAWWAAFLLLLLTFMLQLQLGVTKLEAVFALAFLLMMVAWKEDFPAPGTPITAKTALFAGVGLLLFVPLVSGLAVLALRAQFVPFHAGSATAVDILRRLVYLAPQQLDPLGRRGDWLLEAIPLAFWLGLLLLTVRLLRAARAPHPHRVERETARRIALEFGRTGTAFMSTWRGNSIYLARENRVLIAYRVHAGIAVALGDPIGPTAQRGLALHEFTQFCRERGWSAVFLGATGLERESYENCGYGLLQIGEEAILDLGHLEFKGKHWQNMRSALNRATKQGIEFRLFEGGHVPAEIEAQMHDIEKDWETRQQLPPLEFTLGSVSDVRDPAIEVAVALDGTGRVHGYVDWLPIPAERGWVIDLMRRRSDSMSGTMEFLIGMSLLAFQQQGDRIASLATAPLADLDRESDGRMVSRVLGIVFERFETFYDFRSLFDFKDRFEPRWEPVYIACHDPAELPAIAMAILRAHLPHMGWRQAAQLFGEALTDRLKATESATSPGPSS